MTAVVKDYQMPANEQRLADKISVWGRRQIILRGGNRGVVAAAVETHFVKDAADYLYLMIRPQLG
jgi:hypothetical protein